MFEHLGPTPEVNISKHNINYKLYLSLLILSVFVFMFSMGVSRGPNSQAKEAYSLSAEVFVDSSDKKIVSSAQNFSIFDFVVDVDDANTSLYKLNILVEGIYKLDFIKDLKLFHEGVQLGEISKIDNTGKIYFDLSEYKLKVGKNKFSLYFNNGKSLNSGLALKFSVKEQSDIFLISDGHIFKPQATFPISGGLISIIDKGQVVASNSYIVDDFFISSNTPQQVAAFEVSSIGEKLDLKQITLYYQNFDSEEYQDLNFSLIHDGNLIGEAVSSDGEIVFDLYKTIVLKDLFREKLYLQAMSMPVGVYKFYFRDIKAKGMLSGVEIDTFDEIYLSKVESRKSFLQFKLGELDSRLSEGWNKLYSLNMKTVGRGLSYLNKITFDIDKQNLDIASIEVYKDGEPYIVDIVLKNNRLIIKTDGSNPMEIGSDYTELSILANLVNIKPKAKVEVFVLSDKEFFDEGLLSGNIIWSDDNNFYNGYKIPYLPLGPSILAN